MSVFGLGDLAFMGAASGSAYDADALAYITAVEAADGQALETAVKDAIDAFVRGCKTDGIWTAIKASCILAGARTLAGTLVPLVGPAPTRHGTEVGWNYNRKTGLQGNGTNNYLNSGRNNNADPQNNKHVSVYASSLPTSSVAQFPRMISSGDSSLNDTFIHRNQSNGSLLVNVNAPSIDATAATTGFLGTSRSAPSSYTFRGSGGNLIFSRISGTPRSANIGVFASVDAQQAANACLAFYSIGEALDLALLDARVTALINAFAAAIP